MTHSKGTAAGTDGAGAAAKATTKVGRNDPCPCGSGKKFKHCCQGKEAGAAASSARIGIPPSPPQRKRLQALLLAAKQHRDAERWADAIPFLHEMARIDPNNPQMHRDLGALYLRCGLLAEAADSLQRAVELRPGFHEALKELAYALEKGGKEPGAVLAYRRLSRITDNPLERLRYCARALAMEGKLEEAEKELRRVLALSPQHRGRGLSSEGCSQIGASSRKPHVNSSRDSRQPPATSRN